jgi:hypothetical protein
MYIVVPIMISVIDDLILIFGVLAHLQQYFSYIKATSFSGVPGENHRQWASNW